jgi:hypothetical protein
MANLTTIASRRATEAGAVLDHSFGGSMTLGNFYDEVSRRVDTDKTKINAAATKRVLSEAFKYLSSMDSATFSGLIAQGTAKGKSKK